MSEIKEYWILDGSTLKTYEIKEEIKAKGGKWNPDFKCWYINCDNETAKFFKRLGASVQAKG